MSSPICDIVGKCGAGQLPLIDLLAACVEATWTKQNPEPKYGLNIIWDDPDCKDVYTLPCSKAKLGDNSSEAILRLIFDCDCCGNLAVRLIETYCD